MIINNFIFLLVVIFLLVLTKISVKKSQPLFLYACLIGVLVHFIFPNIGVSQRDYFYAPFIYKLKFLDRFNRELLFLYPIITIYIFYITSQIFVEGSNLLLLRKSFFFAFIPFFIYHLFISFLLPHIFIIFFICHLSIYFSYKLQREVDVDA